MRPSHPPSIPSSPGRRRPWPSHARVAHVLLVADDERPDELLADILDEKTAKDWLTARDSGHEGPG